MRVSVSLALSVLLAHTMYAQEVCSSNSSNGDKTISAGETCTIYSTTQFDVDGNLTNNGTIIANSGSKITFKKSDSAITVTSENNTGVISIRGTTIFDASASNGKGFTIEGQKIDIDSSISLVLKSKKIILGGENRLLSITGNSTSVNASSSWGVTLDTTEELDTKNVELKNIRLTGSELKTLKNTNTTMNNAHIISSSASGLTLGVAQTTTSQNTAGTTQSSFTLVGNSNTISAGTKELKIEGEHSFSGNGILDFVGGTITLGNGTSGAGGTATLKLSNSTTTDKKETPILGFSAESKVLFGNVESSDLTLQIIKSGGEGATLHNVNTTLKGGTLQAIDRDNQDQVLVIENGQSAPQKQAGIDISTNSKDTTTTFKGSGVKIYGQEIIINGDTTHKNTLDIQTINAQGEIYLGKENTNGNQDGYVTIKGGVQGAKINDKKILQLQGVSTTIGGNVTLQDLQVSTYAKNTYEDEGMIFSLADKSTLELNKVTITSGIDGKYQDLSFTTLEGSSTLKISSNDSSIKASSLAFNNQKIDLSNAGSGKALNLYSYGDVALGSATGSGMGHFAFADTTITDGSRASLNLYSSDGAKILAHNLTLNNLTLTTYQINGSSSTKNAIDLSDTGSNLTTQGSVTIDTSKFLYGSTQGIGMDITIEGGEQGDGKLILKSDTDGSAFTFGGTLTIDNSKASNGKPDGSSSQIDITLGSTSASGIQAQASNDKVDLFINGGLTAIGNASQSTTTTTLKAKSFTFGEGSVVSSINGTLSLSANGGGNIDLKKALTILQGVSTAEASISKGSGTLNLGDVIATGKTKIENATFNNSNIKIRSLGSGADTLTINGGSAISGIQTIDIEDAKLDVKNSGSSAELELNVNGSITSNGDSTITASSIKAGDGSNGGTYSIDIQSGTLTLKETGNAGNGIGSLTLGTEGKQGGNLVLTKDGNGNANTLKTTKITSYKDSSITAETFDFSSSGSPSSINGVSISSTGGELKLLSKKTPPNGNDTLTIKQGEIKLDNGSLSYYHTDSSSSSSETLGKMTLYDNSTTQVTITSKGTSSIKAQELDLKDNVITSSGGMLSLQGLKECSTLGAVTINNAGGLTATNSNDLASVKLSSTLTLTANAPYTSSSSPLGGGKFGVLLAKDVNFTQNGGANSPLIHIKVLDKPLEGEELFTLREGGQVVVWTTDGITKGNEAGAKSKQAITLEDITLDAGGYKSLTLSAELIPNSTISNQVDAIKVNLSVAQSSASDLTESIGDSTAKNQMQAILSSGDNKAIIDSILSSPTNPLKVGFAENIIQGNVVVVDNALNYINDTFKSVAENIHLNDRVQTQIYLSQLSTIQNRMARHNNPHQSSSELAKFIHSYHNTAYASSDDELLAPQEQDSSLGKGSLWVSYDGGLGSGNSRNSIINGVSAGYDHAINSNYLVGGFVSYAYGAFDGNYLHNSSHNIGLGLYTRMYFDSNEIDVALSQNIALVTSQIDVGNTTMPSLLNGVMEYNLYRTNLMARYGYSFTVGDEESPYYLKPLVGIGMSYTYQEGSASDAIAGITTSGANLFKLEMSVGMEMRKYINEGTYFFVMPLLERELYGSSCEMSVGFVDSANLNYNIDYQSQTGIALYAGGEGNLTDNLALSGSVGVKVGIEKSEVLTNWSVGLKYKF